VKGDVIGYIIPRTSLEWQVIKNVWQNTYIVRKANLRMAMNCQLYWNFAILHFVLGSHLIFLTKHVFLFVSLLFQNNEMFLSKFILEKYFDRTQHAIKANQSWKIKSILIAKMTRCLLKWYGVPKQILSSHETESPTM
jgi:hypothetical protein